jgi:hypothetical protein
VITEATSPAINPDARPRARRGATLAAVGLAGAGVLGWIAARDPERVWVLPPCPFHAITGWWCPLCGLTRSAHALLNGDVAAALSYNMLTPVAVLVAAWTLVGAVGAAIDAPRPPLKPLRLGSLAQRWLMAGLIAFTVARNLPFGWSRALAP